MTDRMVSLYPPVTALAIITAVGISHWLGRPGAPPDDTVPLMAPPVQLQPPLTPAGSPASPAGVVSFVAFVESGPPASLPLDHSYSAGALRRLATAMTALRPGSALWSERARRLQGAADELERDLRSSRHADTIAASFLDATGWILDLQARNQAQPGVEADQLLAAARAIRPEAPLRSQRAEVQNFFELAARALARGQAI